MVEETYESQMWFSRKVVSNAMFTKSPKYILEATLPSYLKV